MVSTYRRKVEYVASVKVSSLWAAPVTRDVKASSNNILLYKHTHHDYIHILCTSLNFGKHLQCSLSLNINDVFSNWLLACWHFLSFDMASEGSRYKQYWQYKTQICQRNHRYQQGSSCGKMCFLVYLCTWRWIDRAVVRWQMISLFIPGSLFTNMKWI